MKVTIFVLCTTLLLLTSCATEKQATEEKVFVVGSQDQPKVLTFEIEQDNPNAWLEGSKASRNNLNRIRALKELKDENEIFERKSELKNVRRTIDGKTIIGFDEDLDNPKDSYRYNEGTNDDKTFFEEYAEAHEHGKKISFEEY